MPCSACSKARARKAARIRARQEAARQAAIDKAAAAQAKLKTTAVAPVVESDPAPSSDSADSVPEV